MSLTISQLHFHVHIILQYLLQVKTLRFCVMMVRFEIWFSLMIIALSAVEPGIVKFTWLTV